MVGMAFALMLRVLMLRAPKHDCRTSVFVMGVVCRLVNTPLPFARGELILEFLTKLYFLSKNVFSFVVN